MTTPRKSIIIATGLLALVVAMALSWGGYRAVKYVGRLQRESAERYAVQQQRQAEERARVVQARRQDVARKMSVVTLGQPTAGNDVATAAPLGAGPKVSSGLTVVTLGEAPKPSAPPQPSTPLRKPTPAGGLSVVTLGETQSPNPPATQVQSSDGLTRTIARPDLSAMKVAALAPIRQFERETIVAPQVARHVGGGLSRELLVPTPPLAAHAVTGRPQLATLSGIAGELPPALEMQRAAKEQPTPATDDIRIISGFSCSATLAVERVTDTHFKVKFTGTRGSLDNYFLFRLEGVAGRTVRIDFEDAPLKNWWSLNPVYSYATDLDDPASFRSEPVANPKEPVKAHNGPLLPDTSGEQWHFMPNVWSEHVKQGNGRLCMVQTFEKDVVHVGLKVPYTPGLNERLMANLKGNPHATVYEVGRTPQGRPLMVAKIGGNADDDRIRPCLLLYGREHGTEQDSSWAVEGAIRYLMSDEPSAHRLRDRFTFLLVSIMDPDGAASSFYDRISYSFTRQDPSSEAVLYAHWFQKWIDKGNRLDIALDLHNVESAEAGHLFCMYSDPNRGNSSGNLHSLIVQEVRGSTYHVVNPSLGTGYITQRLAGWLGFYFGALPLLYEVNSQEQSLHLSLLNTRDIGRRIVVGSTQYFDSSDGIAFLGAIDEGRKRRLSLRSVVGVEPEVTAIETEWRLRWAPLSKDSLGDRELELLFGDTQGNVTRQ